MRGLKKSFGSLVVLDGIDLDVEEGELQGVIGPNGAGKSTLFNIINGIYTTGSGTISFRGRSIANKPVYRIAAMGIGRTFPVDRVFDEMTVLKSLLVPTVPPPVSRADAKDRTPAGEVKSGAVRVALSGRHISKKKNKP